MRLFNCQVCGQFVYFENVQCEACGYALGYLPDRTTISAVEPTEDGGWRALGAQRGRHRFCANREFDVCNWMVQARSAENFCAACRYNRTVPDLSVPDNARRWARIEAAKHRLFYSLMRLRLPLADRVCDPQNGLAFDFLADPPQSHGQSVMTGHDNGLITLAIKEADDAERERVRAAMGEPYRTLLGHFRHEIGHHFWNRLIRDGGKIDGFRAMFGDERQDYTAALQAYYNNGPAADWQQQYVSAYASSHPWEDFAETWAHYLHIVDTLETAGAFGVKVKVKGSQRAKLAAVIDFDPHEAVGIDRLIAAWLPLAFAVNSLNRSMGQADLYPFVLSPIAIQKLSFVLDVIHAQQAPASVRDPQCLTLA